MSIDHVIQDQKLKGIEREDAIRLYAFFNEDDDPVDIEAYYNETLMREKNPT